MSEDVSAILKQMNEAETAAGSLGGGGSALFCKAKLDYGYKVFASGSAHSDSFFPTDFPPSKESAKVALEKANAFKKDTGTAASPAFSLVLSIEPQDVIGKSVTWKGAQHKVFARWKRKTEDGPKSLLDDIVLPKLAEIGAIRPGTYYFRISYLRDPLNPGDDENPNILWIPAEIFPNEATCRTAATKWASEHESAESGSSDSGVSAYPPGWDAGAWAKFQEQIDKQLESADPAVVAQQWGIDVGWMKAYAES